MHSRIATVEFNFRESFSFDTFVTVRPTLNINSTLRASVVKLHDPAHVTANDSAVTTTVTLENRPLQRSENLLGGLT